MRIGAKDLFASIPPHTYDSFARVVRCSWSVLGGPEKAVLHLPDEGDGLESYQHLLGQPVEIFNSSGNTIWWGYISAVRRLDDILPQVVDLDPMANRVSVCYEELEPGREPGELRQTAWFENLPSQAVYGIKEKVLVLGMVSLAFANQVAQRYLNDHGWPELTLDGHSISLELQASITLKDSQKSQAIELVCQGWIHRLGWRYWQTKSGMVGHSPAQVGVQKIGEVAANQRLAQSFKLEMTQDVSFVKLKLRKEGNPTDSLDISIQSDNAGAPSGTALASATLASSLISADSYGWCQVGFSTLPKLTAGVTYWLVVQRSGAMNPGAYYLAGVDESAGYLDGVLKVFDSSNGLWSMRSPVADGLFQLGLLKASDELIRELFAAVGQELSGLQIEAPTGLTLAPFVPKPMDGLRALTMLLELGGSNLVPLQVAVSPLKMLRIFPQPSASSPVFLIDEMGDLCDRFGNKVDLGSLPTGQWVATGGSQAVFVRRVMWEADTARLTLNY